MTPSVSEILSYFRMGMATGLVDKDAVAVWVDQRLVAEPEPAYELIELSLNVSRSYSQVIGLLNRLEGPFFKPAALEMILARAEWQLEQDPARAVELLSALRLLLPETLLPAEARAALNALSGPDGLAAYLAGYRAARPLLAGLP